MNEELLSEPSEICNELPVTSGLTELPFEKLTWGNFEKFCYQLGAFDKDCLDTSYIYGRSGQAQLGIDLYFNKDGVVDVWQIKRYETFGSADVEKAVKLFLKHVWKDRANFFTLCVSNYLDDTNTVNMIDSQHRILKEKCNIDLVVLNSVKLTEKAKKHPEIITTFFGHHWLGALNINNNMNEKFDKPVDNLTAINNFIKAKDPIEAKQLLDNVYKNKQFDSQYYRLMAQTFMRLKNYPDALEYAKMACKIKSSPSNYEYLSHCYEMNQFPEDSIKSQQKAVELNPRDISAYTSLVFRQIQYHYYDDAISNAKKALTLQPRNAYLLSQISISYEYKNDVPNAIKYIKQAIDIEPNNQEYIKKYNELESVTSL